MNLSTIIVIGGGPRPQSVTVSPAQSGYQILTEDGEVFASGFTDEADALRYLKAIQADYPEAKEE